MNYLVNAQNVQSFQNVDCFMAVSYIDGAETEPVLSPAAEKAVAFLAELILFLRTPVAKRVRFFAVSAISAVLFVCLLSVGLSGQISFLSLLFRGVALAVFSVLGLRHCD